MSAFQISPSPLAGTGPKGQGADSQQEQEMKPSSGTAKAACWHGLGTALTCSLPRLCSLQEQGQLSLKPYFNFPSILLSWGD